MTFKNIMLAVLLIATPLAVNAELRTWTFEVTVDEGTGLPLGTVLSGSVSLDDAGLPSGPPGISQTGLISDLSFNFDGVDYDETTANTGFLQFNADGSLNALSFGTTCTAGSCSSANPGEWFVIIGSARVGDPADFDFAGFTSTGSTVRGDMTFQELSRPSFDDEAEFLTSISNPDIIDFEGLVAPGGFLFLGDPGLFVEGDVAITNNSQMFVQNNNLYGSGAFLSPQGANPHIVDIALPPGTRAIGFSYQSAPATVEINGTETFQLAAVPVASLGFFGVTGDDDILNVRITIDGPGIDLDNIYTSTNVVGTPVTVPADDCTATAGGCNPTGLHEIVLPDGFVVPPGGTITQTAVPFVDPRADASGRCDGQTPLVLFDGDLIIPPYLCGSPEFQVIVTEANFNISEGTIFNTVFPEEFVTNDFDCDVPVVGDPQLQSAFVWQPTDSAAVIEGSAIELTNDCGSSRGRTRGFSFFIAGLHIDFGLDFDADPARVTQAFADLTRTKYDSLVRAVRNSRPALGRRDFFKLSVLARVARALHAREQYIASNRVLELFVTVVERAQFRTDTGLNNEGELLSRADNIRFLLQEFVIPL